MLRNILGDRRGDQNLLRAGGHRGQCAAASGVQFGEDVVEDQYRFATLAAQQLVGRQPQRQSQRP